MAATARDKLANEYTHRLNMVIIPVIDLKNAQVVHAIRGQREQYRPVQSELCDDSEPRSILQAFADNYSFTDVYLADLDAIQGTGSNRTVISSLIKHFSDVTFWIDSGPETLAYLSPGLTNVLPVIGSENERFQELLNSVMESRKEFVLSLDFFQDRFLGDKKILEDVNAWPTRIILMDLDRVGSGNGPDITLIKKYLAYAPLKKFYVGGGVRNTSDLQILMDEGLSGALIATALHNQSITRQDLQILDKKMPRRTGHYHSNG